MQNRTRRLLIRSILLLLFLSLLAPLSERLLTLQCKYLNLFGLTIILFNKIRLIRHVHIVLHWMINNILGFINIIQRFNFIIPSSSNRVVLRLFDWILIDNAWISIILYRLIILIIYLLWWITIVLTWGLTLSIYHCWISTCFINLERIMNRRNWNIKYILLVLDHFTFLWAFTDLPKNVLAYIAVIWVVWFFFFFINGLNFKLVD